MANDACCLLHASSVDDSCCYLLNDDDDCDCSTLRLVGDIIAFETYFSNSNAVSVEKLHQYFQVKSQYWLLVQIFLHLAFVPFRFY